MKQVCDAEEEIRRLRQVVRNVYEVWAGSEGIPMPETAAEAYMLQLLEQMRDEAKNGLHNAALTGAEGVRVEGTVMPHGDNKGEKHE